MSLSVGIVGLPNVGKSTLFNAMLGKQQALAANYPFATIEPNVGVVPVPDERLAKLAEVVHTTQIVPATVTFNDIAGLVKGAATGEGLGNKFLAHIREADLICHVLRDFSDGDVVRAGAVSPTNDYETIVAELILKDLETVERQEAAIRKEYPGLRGFWERLRNHLNDGKRANQLEVGDEEKEWMDQLFLLTAKAEIGVVNVDEGRLADGVSLENQVSEAIGVPVVALSAKVESELVELAVDERREYLRELGVEEPGLDRLIKLAYGRLGLISFLTAGEKEVRAWTVRDGATAPEAAGVIHTDFMKKFIKAKVCSNADFLEYGGWKGAAEKGRVRMEGRDYLVQEGDVIEFMTGA